MSSLLLLASACERFREQDAQEDQQNHGRSHGGAVTVRHWRRKQILQMSDPVVMDHFSVGLTDTICACQWCFYRDPWSGLFLTRSQMRNHLIQNHVQPAPQNSSFRYTHTHTHTHTHTRARSS